MKHLALNMGRLLRGAAFALALASTSSAAEAPKPLKALLIAGGCCHDYAAQKDILKKGIEERAHVTVDVIYSADRSTRARFEQYETRDWADGYDVVIHDECSADVKDLAYVENVLEPHRSGVPAVNLHCAMHSYRTGTEDWFEFLGLQSTGHGPQRPIEITYLEAGHPVTRGLSSWTTGNEELYNNVKLFPSATPLARGKQVIRGRDNTERTNEFVVVWVNDYKGTRVFNTTLGHNNSLVEDPRYLDLVTRGLLWACGKLNDTYLKQKEEAKAEAGGSDAVAVARQLPEIPKDRLPTPEEVRALPSVLPEKAAEHLKEVKVPEGFEATIFATAPAVNYPVFVAAAPDGTLYVSSDGNGSLDRGPHRGRILRVRDLDGDGRADEVKVFVADVDSPRGLVWDYDRLYLLHPPHISVYIDRDRDGAADEHKILVKNIAFGFEDRPADHSSNGLELGIDGWLYAAIGDFGFMEAEGVDGRKLQLRGGGVVRVRPDGTGLELFAEGTRNILEVAVSPLLDGFARDNTNDGGGWDIRLHHFTGLEDHGYPRLFKNFADEIVAPLADYGGGSGCGAAWIDEPGIPAGWNNAPFTADWGRGWVYSHPLTPKGATFSADQKEFVGLTRPTDLDVDALSRIYVASWKGATFNWAGNDVGYIVRLVPKDYTPEPLPNFERATEAELIDLLRSPSHRRRLEAQRTLLRRWQSERPEVKSVSSLAQLSANPLEPQAARVAALFTLKQAFGAKSHSALADLAADPTIAAWAIRALADDLNQAAGVPIQPLLAGLESPDARVRKEAVVALARLSIARGSIGQETGAIVPLLIDPDPVVAHTAMRALVRLRADEACFAALDRPAGSAHREAILRVLRLIHKPAVVDGLLARLGAETDPTYRRLLLTALCRLHFVEGEWKGSSWGTRPDTRGPYYQPEAWEQTPRIAAALSKALNDAEPEEAAFLAAAFARHRIPPGDAIARLLTLVEDHRSIIPALAELLANVETIPDEAAPVLKRIAVDSMVDGESRANAALALLKSRDSGAVDPVLRALAMLESGSAEQERVANALFNSRPTEERVEGLRFAAGKLQAGPSTWADAALLQISTNRRGNRRPSRSAAAAAAEIESGWKDAARRAQILDAIVLVRDKSRAEQVLAAAEDPDPMVRRAAERAAHALNLKIARAAEPKIVDLEPGDVLGTIVDTHGDPSEGEKLFTQLGCVTCHTVDPTEALKGPFLGNISATYKRKELAEAVLVPNRSIAQGFAAWSFHLKNGEEAEGFVVEEAADVVTIRNIAAQEIRIQTSDIVSRTKLEKSLMPEGLAAGLTVKEFASLVDYLENLGGQGK